MYRLKEQILTIPVPVTINELKFNIKNNVTNEIVKEANVLLETKKVHIDLTKLEKHFNYNYYFEEKSDNGWKLFGLSKKVVPIFIDTVNKFEYSYQEEYVSNKLLVIFSSSTMRNRLNYINTLHDYPATKLFLSDENDLGEDSTASYYLGTFKNHDYESKVIDLIEHYRVKNNLDKEDVILIGSSKGGFSSAYFTFKYQYGYCILGSPTIYLGKMHKNTTRGRQIITHLAGDSSEESIQWIDNLIPSQIANIPSYCKIYYHVGEGEPRYTRHAIPLINLLNQQGVELQDLDLGDYSNHSFVADYFPSYLIKILNLIVRSK